jgi:hypothetical protein
MQIAGHRDRLECNTATDATLGIDQNDAIFGGKGGVHGANLHTRRVLALITEFRHEEASQDIRFRRFLSHLSFSRFDVFDFHAAVFLNRVAFHPGAREERLLRHVVLGLARLYTPAAADALVDVDTHSVEVIRRIVSFRGRLGMALIDEMAEQSRGRDEQMAFANFLSIIFYRARSADMAPTEEPSCTTILGASFRSASFAWHLAQNSRVSGFDGATLLGLILCFAGAV